MQTDDTIVAISSAVGTAARMIVRASGREVPGLLFGLGIADPPPAGSALRRLLKFEGVVVPAWIYLFRSPHSYTGEDLLELHIPGNPVLARMLLNALTSHGARQADPGEFTARVYFNGRIDLTKAEGVAATIAAGSDQELSAARQLMAGELARRLKPLLDDLAQALALVEVGIDFSQEDVTFLASSELIDRVSRIDDALETLLEGSHRFEIMAHEPTVVLAGRPNAGKSTLLNALAGHERAVVSPVAGTTRDVLSAHVVLMRGTVLISDIAGLDPATASDAPDPASTPEIDQKMRGHALNAIEQADVVVLVRDVMDSQRPLALSREPTIVVRTKADLSTSAAEIELMVSALTGSGLAELKIALDEKCFGPSVSSSGLALNLRHVRAIAAAREALARVGTSAEQGRVELIALELRDALDALGSVLGQVTPDDVLGRIFAGFCIGK